VALCLAPLVLLTWLTLSLSAGAVRNQVDARVANTASASAVYVREQMDGLAELVGSYAQRPSLAAAMGQPPGRRDARTIAFHLAELQRARKGIAVTFVTEPDGRLVDIVPRTPSIVGQDFSFRDWYRGVTAANRPYVSEAYETAATGHARVVGAAVQVRAPAGDGRRGPVIGILVAAYGLDTIQRFVDDFAAAQGVRLTVTDQRGVVLAAAGAPRVGLVSRRGDPLVRAALQGRAGTAERTTPSGRVVSAYEPVPGLNWTVTADVASDTAFAPVGALRRTVLTIGAVIGLVLLAGLALLARAMRQRARTEQRLKEGQAALRASNERLNLAMDASRMGYWDRDLASGRVVWSAALERLLGVAPGSLDGGRAALVGHVHPDDREAVARWVWGGADGGAPEELQFQLPAAGGATRWMSGRARVYLDDDGRPFRKVGVVADVTERRLGEQALERAKRDADRANRAKSEFLSKMSHELRTPLNAILGFGQLLQLEDLSEPQQESVDHMLSGGRHLLGLINEVLDISRIESGSLSLSLEPVDVAELVKDTVDLIRPLAAEREIEVHAPAASGPAWTVEADQQRLKQVLLNLASNAVKYNRHAGSIHVTCQAPSPGRVAIEVRDSGPGIPADRLGRLFTPFDRLGAEQTEVQGTGMGLVLAKGLVEAMGGSLTADSVEGRGTSFTVELPEAAAVPEPPEGAPAPPPRPAAGPGGDDQAVLYVEDNPSNLRLVERVLAQRGGVRLLTTARGEEVQDLVGRHRPELVLLDLHLPDLAGEEVLRRLQADPGTAGVPVVVVSADVTPARVERVLAAGAREYLAKPLDVARFRAVVDSLLAGVPSRP
jgi:PAS domain S-box-containing protein